MIIKNTLLSESDQQASLSLISEASLLSLETRPVPENARTDMTLSDSARKRVDRGGRGGIEAPRGQPSEDKHQERAISHSISLVQPQTRRPLAENCRKQTELKSQLSLAVVTPVSGSFAIAWTQDRYKTLPQTLKSLARYSHTSLYHLRSPLLRHARHSIQRRSCSRNPTNLRRVFRASPMRPPISRPPLTLLHRP